MKRWVLVLFGLLFLFCACDKNSVSGNSVETENTVALVAVDADGNANEAMTFNYVVKSEAKLVLVKTNPRR